MTSTPSGMDTDESFEQFVNVASSVFTPSGIAIEVSPVAEKAHLPSSTTLVGMLTLLSLPEKAKALSSIVVTPSGITTSLSSAQSCNAASPIVTNPFGNTTFSSFSQR